ncbi:hypothetical protein Z969_00175 [Clostridium novyi A str. 4570]|uniref:Uncharacterized protein n=1 Tax=Clostridium novyi A str. 4570 TaxID=1444290 RepID=A0AA88ZS62_CLONO|nr:hypothetical protein [Clostridium novyi]KGN03423.1 hypothetical protein Z969_00175 [Clostridium novyi A str. 4570]
MLRIDIFNAFFEFIEGMGYKEGFDFNTVKLRYKKYFEQYTETYLKDKSYIFENLIVNYMFSSMFPLGNYDNLFDNYFMMVLKYALIEVLLIGLQGYYKEDFQDKITLKLIQSFEKNIGHNATMKSHIYKLIKNNKFNNMAYACLLIKM